MENSNAVRELTPTLPPLSGGQSIGNDMSAHALSVSGKIEQARETLKDDLHIQKEGSSSEVLNTLLLHLPVAALNARNDDGHTPLMVAANSGQQNNVTALLTAGANVVEKNEQGWTAMFFAAISDVADCIKSILSFGYLSGGPKDVSGGADANATPKNDIDERDNYGNTAFMIAAEKGKVNAMKMLLETGADINATNKRRQNRLDARSAKWLGRRISRS